MNELLVFSELHKFLNSLGPMKCTIAPKSLSIGYKPFTFWGNTSKFATLYGDKRYQCLILHVEPFNPESTKGKELQKEIQKIVGFEISEMRKHPTSTLGGCCFDEEILIIMIWLFISNIYFVTHILEKLS